MAFLTAAPARSNSTWQGREISLSIWETRRALSPPRDPEQDSSTLETCSGLPFFKMAPHSTGPRLVLAAIPAEVPASSTLRKAGARYYSSTARMDHCSPPTCSSNRLSKPTLPEEQ